jgi:hypothetical protein
MVAGVVLAQGCANIFNDAVSENAARQKSHFLPGVRWSSMEGRSSA